MAIYAYIIGELIENNLVMQLSSGLVVFQAFLGSTHSCKQLSSLAFASCGFPCLQVNVFLKGTSTPSIPPCGCM